MGVARKFVGPSEKPLTHEDFSGGEKRVQSKLEGLGFSVLINKDRSSWIGTSDYLVQGRIYSRNELARRFDISDATIKTGIFQPRNHKSIWLFVTEKKTKDRTQYKDELVGDVLHWQGQLVGRKDSLIIEHKMQELELLLFYRRSKSEHPNYGFSYEGPFEYVRHEGSRPASFELRRERPRIEEDAGNEIEVGSPFDPTSLDDARKKLKASIYRRQGQRQFRGALLRAYQGRCAVTGSGVEQILEAAHIHPYRGRKTNHVTNGLLLRADVHTLFDLGLISIDPENLRVLLAESLTGSEYERYVGMQIHVPGNVAERPSKVALRIHLTSSSVPNASSPHS